jgi:monovalent cation:proton antiporter-2 (CPA2) family protein
MPNLNLILILLASAVITVPLFRRLGLGTVLGYLAAGMALGPWGLGVTKEVDDIRDLSEFGIVFLLFLIGLDMKPARLWLMRKQVFGMGGLQVLATGIVFALTALFFQMKAGAAVVIGFSLALSSTAIGLQTLIEKNELASRHGRASFAILLLQDLAVIPLLTLIALLSGDQDMTLTTLGQAAGEAILALGGVMLVGRLLLRPVFRLAAESKNPEIFAGTTVLIVLGTAGLMHQVGLSMALGAFLAGLLMADSEYRHQIEADILPFRGFLLGLFFMTVGMSLDFALLGNKSLTVAGLVLGVMTVKAGVVFLICRLFAFDRMDAMRISLLLAQGGEFAFVLFSLARHEGLLSKPVHALLILAVTLSMAMTPIVVGLGSKWRKMKKAEGEKAPPHDIPQEKASQGHVIIAGLGRVGKIVARMLKARDIPYLGLDRDANRVADLRSQGFEAFFGDASHASVLRASGAHEASLLVVTLDHPTAAERAVMSIRHHYPHLPIHVRTRDSKHSVALLKAGATSVVPEALEASLQLGAGALRASGVQESEIENLLANLRDENYGTLNSSSA